MLAPLGGAVRIGEHLTAGTAVGQLLRLELYVHAIYVLSQEGGAFEGFGTVVAVQTIGVVDVLVKVIKIDTIK